MPLVIVRSYPSGPRCWIVGQRVHHGATGAAMVAAGIMARQPLVVAAGLMLCAHDRHDWRTWFVRERTPTA